MEKIWQQIKSVLDLKIIIIIGLILYIGWSFLFSNNSLEKELKKQNKDLEKQNTEMLKKISDRDSLIKTFDLKQIQIEKELVDLKNQKLSSDSVIQLLKNKQKNEIPKIINSMSDDDIIKFLSTEYKPK